jgi:hypothetical protein
MEREWMADPLLRAHKRRRKADKRMGAAVLCLQRFSYAPHFLLLKPSLLLGMLTCKGVDSPIVIRRIQVRIGSFE